MDLEFHSERQTSTFYSPLEDFEETTVDVEVRDDPLTGRQTTMPPIGYGMDRQNFELVNSLNAAVGQVEDWGAPEILDLLRRHGVTHAFIGARGGALRPELLLDDPHYRLLDTNGAAWLFALDYDPAS